MGDIERDKERERRNWGGRGGIDGDIYRGGEKEKEKEKEKRVLLL